jgi:hypothetical protein
MTDRKNETALVPCSTLGCVAERIKCLFTGLFRTTKKQDDTKTTAGTFPTYESLLDGTKTTREALTRIDFLVRHGRLSIDEVEFLTFKRILEQTLDEWDTVLGALKKFAAENRM